MYNVFSKIKSLFPLWSYEWKRAWEQSDVCCVAAGVGGSFDWVQPDQSPFNKVVKETLLLHDVLPQFLCYWCYCKVRWRHHWQGQIQGLQGEAVSTCQRSSLHQWRWGAPPGLLFPRPLRDLQWLNVLLWTLSMASTRPIIWEINAVSVSCSLKAEKDKSGSGHTVYGCVQFNVVLYIDCFITHLFCVRILFLLSCFHAFESCSIKWQSFLFVFSIFLCKLDNFCNLFHLFYSVSIFLIFFYFLWRDVSSETFWDLFSIYYKD